MKALNAVWSAVKVLARSRKFQVAAISAIIAGAGKIGLELENDDVLLVVTPLWAYIFGVAIEDAGVAKARATLEAEKAKAGGAA